jgi:hypothetical protein
MPAGASKAASKQGVPSSDGGSGGGGFSAGSASEGGSSVLVSPLPPPPSSRASKVSPPPLGRILGNRDFILYVECHGDGAVLKYGNKKFSLQQLAARSGGEHELPATVRSIIARRQATVEPGEPPYRPMARFQVWPDGLRAYYLAYPLLQGLQIPMARENIEP